MTGLNTFSIQDFLILGNCSIEGSVFNVVSLSKPKIKLYKHSLPKDDCLKGTDLLDCWVGLGVGSEGGNLLAQKDYLQDRQELCP